MYYMILFQPLQNIHLIYLLLLQTVAFLSVMTQKNQQKLEKKMFYHEMN